MLVFEPMMKLPVSEAIGPPNVVVAVPVTAKLDEVAFVKSPLVNVPRAEKNDWDEVPFKVLSWVEEATEAKNDVEVAPVLVSMEKTEVEAEFRTSRARPLIGVWMVVVPP